MTTFSSYDSTVNSFYLAFYGRPADPAGLKFWSKQLADNDGDLGAITEFFAASDEAQVRFGTDTVAERIAEIYQQLFNRAPEATGLAFWTKAIENGHASMADVAVSILKGAQGTDAGLATLRQQAVDAFTAQVEAEGSQYDGYASIEAARILVRAVTADSSADDLAALVKAAVSFADTATKNPAVVEAIAVNTTLLALFDTPRGTGDPVALAQALADTAKAAAGDPVTLEQLLRGGGMDKVLKVMPANASLQDVVKALAEGGLPAAVEVVYPTTPSTPAPSYKLSFVGVTQGEGDTVIDHVTRKEIVDVRFSYRGNDLNSSQKYEYSINGGEWISGSEHIVVDTKANTVVLKHLDLSLGEPALLPKSFMGIMGEGPIVDLLSNIELRAVRNDNSVIDSFKQQIVFDHHAAQPVVSVTLSEAAEHFNGGIFTSIPTLFIDATEPGAKVEYSLVTNKYDRIPGPSQTEWSVNPPDLKQDGEYTVLVRQTDVSGNISDERQFTFTLDREKPLPPTIALEADTGIPGDGVTNIAKVKITHLETSEYTGWEYSTNGVDWMFGETNDGSGSAVLDLGKLEAGKVEVQVRQIDAAGNVGDASSALSFTFDATPPAYSISFDSVQQGSNDRAPEDTVTNVKSADVKFSYSNAVAEGLHFEYSVDGGQHWLTANLIDDKNGVVTISGVDLTAGSAGGNGHGRMSIMEAEPLYNLFTTVELRLVDANEFVYASASETVELDRFAEILEVGVTKGSTSQYFGQDSIGHTKVAAINVKGLEEGAVVQYANITHQPQVATFTTTLPSLQDGTHTFLVRQQDAAGNYSDTQEITFTLDRAAPGAATLAIETDSGTVGDGITNVNRIAIENLEQSATSAWEYRIDGGDWTFGERNDGSGKAVLTLDGLKDGTFDIEVRQFDAAGNVGDKTGKLSFELDTTAPVGEFSQEGIEGASTSDTLVTDLPVADVYFTFDGQIEATDTLEYMLDNGKWQKLDAQAYDSASGILTVGNVDFSDHDRNVSVRVTDAAGNTTTSKPMLVDSTLNDVPPVTIDGLTPTFGLSGAKLALQVSVDALASVDKTKLSLDVMNTGTAVDAPGFFDGNASKLTGNTLTLDEIPALNLYQLGWEEGAFTTNKGDAVAAGSALFVGGKIATVALPGYAIESLVLVDATGIDESNDVRVNTAFIGQEGVNARIHSGDGHDVVVDNGSKLTLSYDKLSNTLSDVVFGFDSSAGLAGDIDKIELGGAISTRFDTNHNGVLAWGTAASPTSKYVPQPGIEAVELANLTSKSFVALAGADPLGALNATLDVSGFEAGEGLLILGTYLSQSILLSYVSKDSNGKVDEGELVTIAIYAQGTVDIEDITLVGSFLPPPP